jgi:hypothetical protein
MLPEERSAGHRSLHHLGASGGTRTPNPLIRSQMLYPLSYGRLARDHSVGAPAGTTPFGALRWQPSTRSHPEPREPGAIPDAKSQARGVVVVARPLHSLRSLTTHLIPSNGDSHEQGEV